MKVKVAFLHAAIHIPGLATEQTLNDDKIKGIKMDWKDSNLYIEVPARNMKAVIAGANVKIAIFDEEPKKEKAPKE